MAIVFVSPKERQKMFVIGIVGLFLLTITTIGLSVFFKKPKSLPPEKFFQAPKITINLDILKSEAIKNLEVLPAIEKEFNYQASTAKGKAQTGKVSAVSQEEATQVLTGIGLSNIILEEVKSGRENPFTPFYEITPLKKKK